jgi:hypothetical protein
MDFNQHMRNAAYLGASEDCRMRFLAEHGFAASEVARRRIGPVVVEDRLLYRKELALLGGFRVDVAASTDQLPPGPKISIQGDGHGRREGHWHLCQIPSRDSVW